MNLKTLLLLYFFGILNFIFFSFEIEIDLIGIRSTHFLSIGIFTFVFTTMFYLPRYISDYNYQRVQKFYKLGPLGKLKSRKDWENQYSVPYNWLKYAFVFFGFLNLLFLLPLIFVGPNFYFHTSGDEWVLWYPLVINIFINICLLRVIIHYFRLKKFKLHFSEPCGFLGKEMSFKLELPILKKDIKEVTVTLDYKIKKFFDASNNTVKDYRGVYIYSQNVSIFSNDYYSTTGIIEFNSRYLYTLWRETKKITLEQVGDLLVSKFEFKIPEDKKPSDLHFGYDTYHWAIELEVKAGINSYRETFYIPVFERD